MNRKQTLGKPDQRDLNENLAATHGLAHMIQECRKLFRVSGLQQHTTLRTSTQQTVNEMTGSASCIMRLTVSCQTPPVPASVLETNTAPLTFPMLCYDYIKYMCQQPSCFKTPQVAQTWTGLPI